jgi:hypothetical protein
MFQRQDAKGDPAWDDASSLAIPSLGSMPA